jgi:hypothetical protein
MIVLSVLWLPQSQGATLIYWAPGGHATSDGTWDTDTPNWATAPNTGGTAWNNSAGDIAVFGDPANPAEGPFIINIAAPVSVGGLRFDTLGPIGLTLMATSPAQVMTFTGASPTITLHGNSTVRDALATINAPISGSNGLVLAFDDDAVANPGIYGGMLTLDYAGTSFANTLTGGITVGDKVTLRAMIGSTDPNPLGANELTLQAGSRLDLFGVVTTNAGLSGRVFSTAGTGNSSRVDFTQTATGIPSLGVGATRTDDKLDATRVTYVDTKGVTQTATSYAVQWRARSRLGRQESILSTAGPTTEAGCISTACSC